MATSGISETLAIINRFPIDLELTLGANFTERTTYTGIYNISGLGFDMSFRVQCSENYGPNCTTFCEPTEGVYTCDSDGKIVCLHDGQDLATNCTTCLPGWDIEANCAVCLPFYDIQFNCSQCLAGRDICTNCSTCLPGYLPSIDDTSCLPNVQCQPTQVTSTVTAITSSSKINALVEHSIIVLCFSCAQLTSMEEQLTSVMHHSCSSHNHSSM